MEQTGSASPSPSGRLLSCNRQEPSSAVALAAAGGREEEKKGKETWSVPSSSSCGDARKGSGEGARQLIARYAWTRAPLWGGRMGLHGKSGKVWGRTEQTGQGGPVHHHAVKAVLCEERPNSTLSSWGQSIPFSQTPSAPWRRPTREGDVRLEMSKETRRSGHTGPEEERFVSHGARLCDSSKPQSGKTVCLGGCVVAATNERRIVRDASETGACWRAGHRSEVVFGRRRTERVRRPSRSLTAFSSNRSRRRAMDSLKRLAAFSRPRPGTVRRISCSVEQKKSAVRTPSLDDQTNGSEDDSSILFPCALFCASWPSVISRLCPRWGRSDGNAGSTGEPGSVESRVLLQSSQRCGQTRAGAGSASRRKRDKSLVAQGSGLLPKCADSRRRPEADENAISLLPHTIWRGSETPPLTGLLAWAANGARQAHKVRRGRKSSPAPPSLDAVALSMIRLAGAASSLASQSISLLLYLKPLRHPPAQYPVCASTAIYLTSPIECAESSRPPCFSLPLVPNLLISSSLSSWFPVACSVPFCFFRALSTLFLWPRRQPGPRCESASPVFVFFFILLPGCGHGRSRASPSLVFDPSFFWILSFRLCRLAL